MTELPATGLLLTFEGIDGSGKSLQAAALVRRLQDRQYNVLLARDPGGPPIAEAIRHILLDRDHHAMAPMTELFLYEAARSQLVSEIIGPALDRGTIVVCDRYIDSTTAYQSYGRGLPVNFITHTNHRAAGRAWPARTFILDIPWEESQRRRTATGEQSDRMESDIAHFYHNVISGYHEIAKADPERVRLLDGCRSVKSLEREIFEEVLYIIENRNSIKAYKEKE
jgi:dTMP kinase